MIQHINEQDQAICVLLSLCLSSGTKPLSSSSMQECCGCELINNALPPPFEKDRRRSSQQGKGGQWFWNSFSSLHPSVDIWTLTERMRLTILSQSKHPSSSISSLWQWPRESLFTPAFLQGSIQALPGWIDIYRNVYGKVDKKYNQKVSVKMLADDAVLQGNRFVGWFF